MGLLCPEGSPTGNGYANACSSLEQPLERLIHAKNGELVQARCGCVRVLGVGCE